MKRNLSFVLGVAATVLGLLGSGCASNPGSSGITSPYHPGPVAGRAVGTGVGVVAGNAAGFAVGVGEGLVEGAAAPFDSTTRVVRHWRTETTADGRTIQVPVDILVDANGRPVNMPAANNPAPSQKLNSPKDAGQ